ncbi:MAG TPA: type I polyketide synthase [Terracidiphilus sp.]|nr:type I polyketide synthase [Terracidiphilus sp.]
MNLSADPLNGLTPLQRAAFALKEMRARLDAAEQARSEPIAIIGMGCRFPGGASNPERYWELLRDGVDAIVEVPRSRWNVDEYYDPDPAAARKTYVREGGFLREPMDAFDARFFGIVPREAAGMDPQQRLLLEVSWEALEHAGIAPDSLAGSSVGVYIGVITADFGMVHPFDRLDPQDVPYVSTGSATSFPAGRISYVLGLQGPCMVVATACSSALVSTHLAMQALRNGECEMALAGGVNLMFAPEIGVSLSRMRALAPDGRSKAFDAAADGYGRGEGCGIVVLKRLSDATRDGDKIWAVLKGSAVNHDGASGGLSVPNGPAQETVLRKALAAAAVAPHEMDYVEAHGTGTALGDPIEANALDAVMRIGREAGSPLLVGSVKTNIGHLESAAGVAGLIKVVLALHHQSIPPSLHFRQPNPHIDWDRMCLNVPVRAVPWPAGERRRLAGVSSFGLSGINAHLVVGEAPQQPQRPEPEDRPSCRILALSARTEAGLGELAQNYREALEARPLADEPMADLCGTASEGRSHFEFRAFAIGADHAELSTALEDLSAGRESRICPHGRVRAGESPKVAFLFTGQGSQCVGMGRQLYMTHARFRKIIDRCDNVLSPRLGRSLQTMLHEGPDDLLGQTGNAQPALFALSVALAEVWKSWGVFPAAVMGHSVGEYAAACVAGVLTLEDGLRLIAERGRLMQALPSGGTMAAVFAEPARVREILRPYADSVGIAAINGPAETVISGERGAMERVLAAMEREGIRNRSLRVSNAFHSRLMEPMIEEYRSFASGIPHSAPHIELVSNLDGEAVSGSRIGADYWCDHIRRPVQFARGMAALANTGFNAYVEIGPQPVLIGLGARCVAGDTCAWLPSLRRGREDWRVMLASLGELYLRGCPIDWGRVNGPHRTVVLPTYPFQRQRHWVEMLPAAEASSPRKPGGHPLLGARIDSAAKAAQFEARISAASPSYLQDHRLFGIPVLPGAAIVEMALAAGATLTRGARISIEELVFLRPLQLSKDVSETVQLIASPSGGDSWEIEVFRRDDSVPSSGGEWGLLAKGRIRNANRPSGGMPVARGVHRERRLASVGVEGFYRELREHGLDYGPAFQALREVESVRGEVTARICLPDDAVASAGPYLLHPVILDASLQALGAALAFEDRQQAYVPVALEGLRHYQPSGTEVWVHAQLDPSAKLGSGALSASLRLTAPDGTVIAEVDSVRFTRATRQSLNRSSDALSDWMYEVKWEPKAIAARTESDFGHWLIVGKSEFSGEICDQFREAGHSCEALSGILQLDALLDGGVDQSVNGVVDLSNLDEAVDARPDEAAEHNSIRLLHLSQALSKIKASPVPRLSVVTRGAAPARDYDIGVSGLSHFPLAPMARAIAHELPELRCRTIDLDASSPDGEAARLYEELIAEDAEDHVAFRDGQRLVARLVRSAQQPPNAVDFDQSATYLITGGLGGLGLQVARWMAARGARRIVLMSRRAPSAQAAKEILSLRESGAEIHVVQADVAKREDWKRVLSEIAATGRALRGVVHAAGILDDGIILNQTAERFSRVLEPKVRGAWLLHELTQETPLDFLVLFSSAASMMGKPGQLNYVAANAFLDGLACYRRSLGLPGLSIAWGAWQGVGAAMDIKQDPALGAITAEQGLQLLEAAIARNLTTVGVLPVDWDSLESKLASPFFSEVAGGRSHATTEIRLQIERLPEKEREAALLAHVCTQVRNVSGLAEHEFDPQQGFFSLGLDSLMSVDLRNRLQASLGCSLPATIAFQYPSATSLAAHLAHLIGPAAPDHHTDDATVEGPGVQDGSELDVLLTTVGAMSEEEAAAALGHTTVRTGVE